MSALNSAVALAFNRKSADHIETHFSIFGVIANQDLFLKYLINQPIRLPGLKPGVWLRRELSRTLSLPAGRQGLILQSDRLSVLSLPKEAALFTPI
jgi:hypothetical protein